MKKLKKIKDISKIKLIIVKCILFLGQKTLIGRGQIRKRLVNFINYLIGYGSMKDSRFICKVNNVPFNFYNDKLTFIKFYFGRNENKEIDFIKKNTTNNSVFIDIGSNMGLYTQNIAHMINKKTKIKIISIDANPINNFRLRENLKLLKYKTPNIFSYVKIKNCAVGNHNTLLNLDFSKGLANGYISKDKKNISVKCVKLLNIVNKEKLDYITNLKIDIEGFEDKVLITFFKNCKKKLFPKNIILEHSSKKEWKYNLLKFLFNYGYKEIFRNKANIILSLT
jgi:FkbM family methyltransferase